MIKNVVFDIGNVLVDFRWRELMKILTFPKKRRIDLKHQYLEAVGGMIWIMVR